MEKIFPFIIPFILSFLIVFLLTRHKKKESQEILKLCSNKNLKKVEVKISESKYFGFFQSRGTAGFIDATMFYAEDILIFTNPKKWYFGGWNNLPIVVNPETIKYINISSDQYILYVIYPTLKRELKIYSDQENDLLKVIFTNLKEKYISKV